MKNFGVKFALIAALALGGIYTIWANGLQLGIDLSGGTILVYQVKEENRTKGNRMDDLIAAIRSRVNPEGLKDIPIRAVGNNRFEIILAEASPEEVDRLKRKMTDVGALEFRILANEKKDGAGGRRGDMITKAMASDINDPPNNYGWARLGEIVTGNDPKTDKTQITDLTRSWSFDRYKGVEVVLTGKDATGREQTDQVAVESNTDNTLTLVRPHRLAKVDSYRLEYNPSEIVAGPNAIVREVDRGGGLTERYILYKLDNQDVTGEYLNRVTQTQDESLQPAVGFYFNSTGARKFGALTRDTCPRKGARSSTSSPSSSTAWSARPRRSTPRFAIRGSSRGSRPRRFPT